jgi:Ni,Fe-hydrogenase III large subunit
MSTGLECYPIICLSDSTVKSKLQEMRRISDSFAETFRRVGPFCPASADRADTLVRYNAGNLFRNDFRTLVGREKATENGDSGRDI